MDRDDASLLDIARAARLTLDFCPGMTKAQFLNDLKTQSAVLHQLLILGKLPSGFQTIFGSNTLLSLGG